MIIVDSLVNVGINEKKTSDKLCLSYCVDSLLSTLFLSKYNTSIAVYTQHDIILTYTPMGTETRRVNATTENFIVIVVDRLICC